MGYINDKIEFLLKITIFTGVCFLKILLFCAGGLSSRLLMTKIQKEAERRQLSLEIRAVGLNSYARFLSEYDVCLVAPQVHYKLNEAKKLGLQVNIPIDVIDRMDYGMCNGSNVLDQAIRLVSQK